MNTTNRNAVFTGLIALVVGVGIGVAATAARAGSSAVNKTDEIPTNQMAAPLPLNPEPVTQAEDPFREIQDMQMQMDRMFSQMSSQFSMEPQFSNRAGMPGYSLSLNVQDLKNRYVVRAVLPDTKVSDVNVKLENDQTLKVNVSNQQTQTSEKKNLAASASEWGQYEQVIQLPTPVKVTQMKVTRGDHELVITLPKA